MIVDLTDGTAWPKEFDLTVEPDVLDLASPDTRITGSVNARGIVEKRAGWFEVHGSIAGPVATDCSRCLEPVEREVSIPFNIRLIRTEDSGDSHEREVDTADLDSSEIENDEVDLREIIREQILLDLPEQVYCKEDCKGLCPKCGANRNLIDCKCQDEEIDPRWRALKDLK